MIPFLAWAPSPPTLLQQCPAVIHEPARPLHRPLNASTLVPILVPIELKKADVNQAVAGQCRRVGP